MTSSACFLIEGPPVQGLCLANLNNHKRGQRSAAGPVLAGCWTADSKDRGECKSPGFPWAELNIKRQEALDSDMKKAFVTDVFFPVSWCLEMELGSGLDREGSSREHMGVSTRSRESRQNPQVLSTQPLWMRLKQSIPM